MTKGPRGERIARLTTPPTSEPEFSANARSKAVGDLQPNLQKLPVTSAERNGVPLLPVRRPEAAVTVQIVNALRDG
jgi:hypothetical protein